MAYPKASRTPVAELANRLLLALLVMSAAVFASIALAQTQVTVAIQSEPSSLDPNIDETTFAQTINQAIYGNLVKMDADLLVIPWLAESWEALDDLTWRFYLRQGVQFHSGNPFNAEAVKAHYERARNADDPGTQSQYLFMVDEIIVVDDYTVEFTLNQPYGPFVADLTLPHLAIIDALEADRLGASYGANPSGTGPFRLVEWVRGSRITLEANPDFWQDGKPGVDRLEFVFVPEASGRITALELGEVDIIVNIPSHEIARLDALPNIYTVSAANLRAVIYKFNLKHELLSDVSVRRAIVHAVDIPLIADLVLEEAGEALRGFIGPGVFGALEAPYEYNPELSARILETAGWSKNRAGFYEKDGEVFTVSVMTAGRFPRDIEVAEAVQIQLLDFGIDFRIDRTEHARILEVLQRAGANQAPDAPAPEFEMIIWGVGIRNAEAGIALNQEYVSGGGWNGGHYSSSDFDRLVQIGNSTGPEHVRRQALEEAQRVLYADVPSLPLFAPTWLGAASSRIGSFDLHPTEQYFWGDVTLD